MCLRSSLFSPGEEAAARLCVCMTVCVCSSGKQERGLAHYFSLFMAACLLGSKHKHDQINKQYCSGNQPPCATV